MSASHPHAAVSSVQGAIRPFASRAGADERSLVLGRLGSLEVRLAGTSGEIMHAQALRHDAFFSKRSRADTDFTGADLDADGFDADCDHLIVAVPGSAACGRIVATCRLSRRQRAVPPAAFWSAREFDISPVLDAHAGGRVLELGRVCVHAAFRGGRAVEALWHGIWAYCLRHRINVMLGCASFEGTDAARWATPLSFLHHHGLAPVEWRARARPEHLLPMNLLPKNHIDVHAALRALPPLIKSYVRLGAKFGEGAVLDERFGTIDVFAVLRIEDICARYIRYFGAEAGRYAA